VNQPVTNKRPARTGAFTPLLLALVGVIVTSPLLSLHPLVGGVVVLFVLIAGIFAVQGRIKLRLALIVLTLVVMAFRWLAGLYGLERPAVVLASHVSIALYIGIVAVFCITTVLRHRPITRDTVVGAICGYILIAFIFAYFYIATEDFLPGSFAFSTQQPVQPASAMGRGASEFMYFSFVTLTSVGYGDIAPVHPLARALAILQMVGGQLYLAAFVARLVGVMATSKEA